MRSFLGSPIRLGDEPLGNLYLTEKAGGKEFTAEDERLLVLFAAQAALAIRNAGLHQSVEAERQQLRALIDTSPVGVLVAEAVTQGVLFANHDMARLLGFPHEPGDTLKKYEEAAQYRRPDGMLYDNDELPIRRALL